MSQFYNLLTPAQKRDFIKNLSTDQLKYLIELIANVQLKRFQISDKAKKRLCKYKKSIIYCTDPKRSLKKKKKVIQSGGFVGSILLNIASALLPVILEKINQK
jgi:hypothetical protein